VKTLTPPFAVTDQRGLRAAVSACRGGLAAIRATVRAREKRDILGR